MEELSRQESFFIQFADELAWLYYLMLLVSPFLFFLIRSKLSKLHEVAPSESLLSALKLISVSMAAWAFAVICFTTPFVAYSYFFKSEALAPVTTIAGWILLFTCPIMAGNALIYNWRGDKTRLD